MRTTLLIALMTILVGGGHDAADATQAAPAAREPVHRQAAYADFPTDDSPEPIERAALRTRELAEAISLFERRGLDLPDFELRYYDEKASCNGHLGVFRRSESPWQIRICTTETKILIHELAHAWIEANVDERIRGEYAELREFTNWNDSSVEWADRAVEDAAFVMHQILLVGPGPADSPEWTERRAAFELLTRVGSSAT